jgi:Fe-S-cluster-containing hydrogenase component 2
MIVATALEKQRDASKRRFLPPVILILTMALDFMQFNDDQETAVKCDLCVERLKNEQAPACYSVCPTGCISKVDKGGFFRSEPIAVYLTNRNPEVFRGV